MRDNALTEREFRQLEPASGEIYWTGLEMVMDLADWFLAAHRRHAGSASLARGCDNLEDSGFEAPVKGAVQRAGTGVEVEAVPADRDRDHGCKAHADHGCRGKHGKVLEQAAAGAGRRPGCFRRAGKRHGAGCDADAPAVRLSAETLTGSVSGAMRSLGGICGMVLFFGAAMRLSGMERIPHPLLRALCTVLTDITQLPALLHCGLHFRTLLAVSAGLLAFGGICVHAQCIALGVSGLHPGRLLLFRMAAAAAVGGIVFLFAGLIALPESVPAFAPQVSVSRTGSPLPALLIFCTGFPILIKKD